MSADMFDVNVRNAILRRLRSLTPGRPPRWGSMSPHQAVCHLTDCMRVVFGDRPCRVRGNFYATRLGRWLAIDSPIPWPRGRLKAAPELLVTRPGASFGDDLAALIALLQRFAAAEGHRWGESPVFGRMSGRRWARYAYRHVDHHLRQYGV